jgi:hypothetical protein
MNIKEQLRQATISHRVQDQQRQEKALGRAAAKVGLDLKDATEHTWKSYVS